MKRIIIFLIIAIVFKSAGQERRDNRIIDRTIEVKAENKLIGDTMFVDLTEYVNIIGADSLIIVTSFDTIEGCNSDTIGTIPAVEIKSVPVLRIAKRTTNESERYFVNDTLVNGEETLVDSILSIGNARQYSMELLHLQYLIIHEFNFDDTSKVSNATKVKINSIVMPK